MICIVGADGFFGSYMQQHILTQTDVNTTVCLNHCDNSFSVNPFVLNAQFELWDNDSIKKAAALLSVYSDIRILFLASAHNPDIVKKDPDKAQYINTVCYERFLNEISGLDIRKLVYASSDTVYGESIDGYAFSEDDTPAPINIYGKQKLMAEEITYKYGYTAARYSYMCAPSLINRKRHFFDEISEKLQKGEKIYMLTDWVRSALSYKSASEITYRLLLSNTEEKTVNICGDTPVSKYDIGIKAAEYAGADTSLVVPCTMDELNIFTEKRAKEIIMSNKLSKAMGIAYDTSLIF